MIMCAVAMSFGEEGERIYFRTVWKMRRFTKSSRALAKSSFDGGIYSIQLKGFIGLCRQRRTLNEISFFELKIVFKLFY